MVREQVVGLSAGAHRDPAAAGVVVLDDRPVGLLVVVANVDRRRAAEGRLDPIAVRVVDETGRGRSVDRRQSVLAVTSID